MSRFTVMPRAYRRQLQAADHEAVNRAVQDAGPIQHSPGATAPGDSRKLRGIPAVSRSVTGAIRGSIPHRDGLGN